jgi:hypothetical protein
MINARDNDVAWAMFITELDEAREHLTDLIDGLVKAGEGNDVDLSIHLGHVYAHLNRAWHSRNQDHEISEEQWPRFSQFPKDVEPVG